MYVIELLTWNNINMLSALDNVQYRHLLKQELTKFTCPLTVNSFYLISWRVLKSQQTVCFIYYKHNVCSRYCIMYVIGVGSERLGTRFWDNKWPKRTITWANFLVGFCGPRPLGAGVEATPIFPPKRAQKLKWEIKCHSIDFTLAIER